MMTSEKIHIGLLFGGNSSEHDVSKRSAHNIYDAMDKNKYEVSLFMFTKEGVLLGDAASRRIFDGEPEAKVVADVLPTIDFTNPLANIMSLTEVKDIDLFYPVIHGNMGEDGTIQGLFKLLDKPYIGSDVRSSAISFDKDLTKKMLTLNNIRNTKYLVVKANNRVEMSYARISKELGDVVFIKPANQGSSVGIHKAHNEKEFLEGIEDAFLYDTKILVEESIENPDEIECSILGNTDLKASKLGAVIVPKSDVFYDYNNKFVDASGVEFEMPVELPDELTKEIQDMSLRAFEALGCRGLARIDFLVKDGIPYLGELNTLPGFTNISLYPQLWEVSGIGYSELIDKLIQLAFDEHAAVKELHYDFTELPEI